MDSKETTINSYQVTSLVASEASHSVHVTVYTTTIRDKFVPVPKYDMKDYRGVEVMIRSLKTSAMMGVS
jgi:hypothetical protein